MYSFTEISDDMMIVITLLILPILYTIVVLLERMGKKVSKLKLILQGAIKCEIILLITLTILLLLS